MQSFKLFVRVVLAAYTLVFLSVSPASVSLVDTGPGCPMPFYHCGWGSVTLNSEQWLAGQFTLTDTHKIGSVEGWFGSTTTGTAHAAIYNDTGGGTPSGMALFSKQFTLDQSPGQFPKNVNAWDGAYGLNWTLEAGTYWLAFEVHQGDTSYGWMTPSAPNPLTLYSSASYGTWHPRPSLPEWGYYGYRVNEALISAAIDIKPGSDPNPVNPKSKGVIPVAVLGSIDFDATQVDFLTVRFGPDGASPAHDGHVEYVNDDGFMDMVFHFKTQETGIVCGGTEATLIGDTFDGTPITGSDSLTTVGCSKKDDEDPSLTFTPDEWTLTLDTVGPGIHTIFMIADVSPLAVNDVQDLGGKLIWAETQIELCADPTYPPDVWGEFISIREVGNGFLKIGDGFQTSSDDCTINTTMQMAFDDFGLPNEACLSVRTGGVDFEYCAPLAVRTTPTLLGLSMR